ncbi:MAG: hypothetical protein ABL953_13815 [Ilumatobacteraceae bacterium]
MTSPLLIKMSRRHFLAASGGALALAACADSNVPDGFLVVQRFPNHPLYTPGDVRLPISLADPRGNLIDGDDSIEGWIEDVGGERFAEFTAKRRGNGIEVPYWEVRANLPLALVYRMRLEGDDGEGALFELYNEIEINSPVTGAKMGLFKTPTVDNHRGVEPYCSLTPDPCPLHEVTLEDALLGAATSGTPVIYMIGTPAHCVTGTCAPGLELLVAEHERLGDQITMIHADVYADDAATTVAPAVTALKVEYEPIVYFCTSDAVIVDRLDVIWDADELRERIDLLLAR